MRLWSNFSTHILTPLYLKGETFSHSQTVITRVCILSTNLLRWYDVEIYIGETFWQMELINPFINLVAHILWNILFQLKSCHETGKYYVLTSNQELQKCCKNVLLEWFLRCKQYLYWNSAKKNTKHIKEISNIKCLDMSKNFDFTDGQSVPSAIG